jgi:protocatechuate 3,4-dioxygenase beta subunit
MERKDFIKTIGLGAIIVPFIKGCEKDASAGDGSCTVTPSETAGPFPTKTPAALLFENITSDRTGISLSLILTIQNRNNGCAPLSDAVVDVWHCDKDGYYSEYGGTGMQSENFQSVDFLRGRQSTNNDGVVSFKTIFPGWYSGRAPHIHVHIYDSAGTSLLVTQIAFPAEVCNNVYSNVKEFYSKGTQDTSNESDNVFSDSLGPELAILTGNITSGYQLKHRIIVKA